MTRLNCEFCFTDEIKAEKFNLCEVCPFRDRQRQYEEQKSEGLLAHLKKFPHANIDKLSKLDVSDEVWNAVEKGDREHFDWFQEHEKLVVGVAKEIQKLKAELPILIACSRRTKIKNRDYIQGFQRGFEQGKEKVLALLEGVHKDD